MTELQQLRRRPQCTIALGSMQGLFAWACDCTAAAAQQLTPAVWHAFLTAVLCCGMLWWCSGDQPAQHQAP